MEAAGDLATLVGKGTVAAVEQMQLYLGEDTEILLLVVTVEQEIILAGYDERGRLLGLQKIPGVLKNRAVRADIVINAVRGSADVGGT
ncbi:hypothetical protein DTW90_33265 [Neorhizobium sp. P12A]|uniref:hypothetical protein n=1 Tax=Neorhizobium sp. P12A TaxID=2268027 RepID=UPI0011EDAA29|nr:hypothetical protein [Neorhizobium sp. P12A]KAA0687343.1 hypothetical protein DTW90_33265 [Neorhizobium sp. P12A]